MNQRRIRQITLAITAVAVAVLALAVFLWGVEYKMSLYPAQRPAPTRVPMAKLLSESERPASRQAASSLRTTVSLGLFFTLGLFLTSWLRGHRAGPQLRAALSASPADGPRRSAMHHFFFRPPPLALA
jgi:hypothetical protein